MFTPIINILQTKYTLDREFLDQKRKNIKTKILKIESVNKICKFLLSSYEDIDGFLILFIFT
jgi:hypothetical protein